MTEERRENTTPEPVRMPVKEKKFAMSVDDDGIKVNIQHPKLRLETDFTWDELEGAIEEVVR